MLRTPEGDLLKGALPVVLRRRCRFRMMLIYAGRPSKQCCVRLCGQF